MSDIRVLINGACGKMGREVVKAVTATDGMEIIAAVDRVCTGEDVGLLTGIGTLGVPVTTDLTEALNQGVDVVVDFTIPAEVMGNLRTALLHGTAAVVGTTGLTSENLAEVREMSAKSGSPVFIAPNFAIGAVLMMQMAEQAAKYFDYAEVIEFHHEKKLDAPSGTALRTAELMKAAAAGRLAEEAAEEQGEESRGVAVGNIRVHAARLPGMVASQEVIFGGLGQTLTIRHDTVSRESFMPGILLAIRKVRGLRGVVVGLEAIM